MTEIGDIKIEVDKAYLEELERKKQILEKENEMLILEKDRNKNKLYVENQKLKIANAQKIESFRAKIINDLLSKYEFISIKDTNFLYVYNAEKGIYELEKNTGIIANRIFIERQGMSPNIVKDIRETLSSLKKYDVEIFSEDPYLCAVKNGVLDLRNGELKPFDSKYKFLGKINVEYKKDTGEPEKFLKFLYEILDKDDVITIQELMGYLLYRSYDISDKMFSFFGDGRNGKGQLIECFERMLGKNNVSHQTIGRLSYNPFSPGRLFGKMLNESGETGRMTMNKTDTLKALTGMSPVNLEKKGKDSVDFLNYAKIVTAFNEPPVVEDSSLGFRDRQLVIGFDNAFVDNDPRKVVSIAKKICTQDELEKMLNWSVIGFQRLNEQKHFTVSEKSKRLLNEWLADVTELRDFLKHILKRMDGNKLATQEVYDHVTQKFGDKYRRNRVTREVGKIFRDIKKEYVTPSNGYVKGQVQCFLGLTIRDELEAGELV